MLETEVVIPAHADVANAIGAITSRVRIRKKVEILPGDDGQYLLTGLANAPSFSDYADARQYAAAQLRKIVLDRAIEAGTSETHVDMTTRDRVAPAADGTEIFLGCDLVARLSGRPDVARLAESK